jgi:membrane protein
MSLRAPVMLRMFGTAIRAWWDDDVIRLGASLAYYTLFAIAPVLLVATAIGGMASRGRTSAADPSERA